MLYNSYSTVPTYSWSVQGVIINACGDINVQSVQVQSGGKLILDAAGTTTIQGGFKVELGSSLEIK